MNMRKSIKTILQILLLSNTLSKNIFFLIHSYLNILYIYKLIANI